MKQESKFLAELEARAREQRKLAETEILPQWARGIGAWLTQNPWRVIVPGASIVYGVLRIGYGTEWREFILGLFGGF